MPTTSDKKLAELILYISDRSELDPYFGATKLNKILFFSELSYFAKHERGITEQEYIKRDYGPVPRDMATVQKKLVDEGALVIKETDRDGYKQKKPIALREPDLSHFSAEEIDMVDRVMAKLRDHTATDVSELSHQMLGWELAKFGQIIPLYTVFFKRREATPADNEWAKTITPHA